MNSQSNSLELAQQLLRIYQQIIHECEQILNHYPLDEGKYNRDNLLAYLSLRELNLFDLHQQLAGRGLASLEQSHTHVLYTLKKILSNLNISATPPRNLSIPTPKDSKLIPEKRAGNLFGKKNSQLQSTIMVTLDAKMINNKEVIEELLQNGMNIARINCAHDDQEVWKQLIACVREAEEKQMDKERTCKIYMDLSGPKVRVGELKPAANITVRKGDFLRLYLHSKIPGHPATDESPAGIPVTLEKAFRNVRINDRIYIDDGKVYGRVRQITNEYIQIEILSMAGKPLRIKEGKGINLPDSLPSLNVPALTEKDILDLPFITQQADIIGVSFVHTPLDLKKLREQLEKHAATNMPIVAKIETKDAVHHLARIILEGLNFNSFGIMIARGDLAVEVGPEYLSLVQEEILSICSAAYIPVIWATGVLEKLTKKGIPARSEITDAAQGKRADCIMLNKGPFIIDSLKMLNKLLRMDEMYPPRQQEIKRSLTTQYGVFHN